MHYEVLVVVYLYYFLVTNLLELPVVLLWSRLAFDRPAKRAVWVGILCQVATHPFFVGLPFVVTAIMGESAPDWLRYLQEHDLLKEVLLIPLIEATLYWALLKPLKAWQALVISYSANLVSWGIGLFVPSAWIYHLMLPGG